VKSVSESWDEVGPLLRLLASVTPKLMNAAYDTLVACRVAGKDAVKVAISPDSKGVCPDTLAYQAVNREAEKLRRWGENGNSKDYGRRCFAMLDVPSSSATAIARAAKNALARRDQGRVRFSSERILVPGAHAKLRYDRGETLVDLKLRRRGVVTLLCAHSSGAHRQVVKDIASGVLPHGEMSLQYDRDRRKWYVLISYEMLAAEPMSVDPRRVLAVHRGIRHALYPICSTGEHVRPFIGSKFAAQKRHLMHRMSDLRRTGVSELGQGAKGHGHSRRYRHKDSIGDKVARVTKTFCQQAAAWVADLAILRGCGLVVIEDYGGVAPAETPQLRRVLERFPLDQLKTAIETRLEYVVLPGGGAVRIALKEVSSKWISSKCPRCFTIDPSFHNMRTNVFHCVACGYNRSADWVAAYWMLTDSGADMGEWHRQLQLDRDFGGAVTRNGKEAAE
jgi:transposase